MTRKLFIIALAIWLATLLAACTPAPDPAPSSTWKISHLRALDPSDTHLTNHDLIALYSRQTTYDLELRLDLLDLQRDGQADLYLALDWLPGGQIRPEVATATRKWDLLIRIPAGGRSTTRVLNPVLNSGPQPTPRVVRDPQLDTILVRLNRNRLMGFQGNFHVTAYSTFPNQATVSDLVPPVSSAAATTARAPVIFAFWNTLPAHTPAQALRRWDGAHTGPLGQRHGLRHLLDAAEETGQPIFLLDAATPFSLSALDAMGKISRIQALRAHGLLSLPERLPERLFGDWPDWANNDAHQWDTQVRANFGLPQAALRADVRTDHQAATRILLYTSSHDAVLALPAFDENAPQISRDGLDIDLRRELLAAAQRPPAHQTITLLGGNLPHSNWGDAHLSGPALAYIAAHPWMQPLDAHSIRQVAGWQLANSAPRDATAQEGPFQAILAALETAPESTSTTLAWQMLFSLSIPADPSPPELAALRARYLGEIGNLLAAARWETAPMTTHGGVSTDCSQDTDFDGVAECQLRSAAYFAIIDPQGARLSLLLARPSAGSVVQLVAPSSQFSVGLSDPSTWDLAAGLQADPAVIPGAFAGPWEPYQTKPLAQGLQLHNAEMQKEFRLTPAGLEVSYRSDSGVKTVIPLGIVPQHRFTPGWATRYTGATTPQGWAWGIETNARVLIQTSGTLSHLNFSSELPALQQPENPNYDYAPGHYLPFPVALAKIQAENEVWVQISLIPADVDTVPAPE